MIKRECKLEDIRFSKKCFLNFAKFTMHLSRSSTDDKLSHSYLVLERIVSEKETVPRVWVNDFLKSIKEIQDAYLKNKFKIEPLDDLDVVPVIPEIENLECSISLVQYLKILNFIEYRLPLDGNFEVLKSIKLLKFAAEKDIIYNSEEYKKANWE